MKNGKRNEKSAGTWRQARSLSRETKDKKPDGFKMKSEHQAGMNEAFCDGGLCSVGHRDEWDEGQSLIPGLPLRPGTWTNTPNGDSEELSVPQTEGRQGG